ncbi:hypothetical protein DL96DRAFT_1757291 [Flagelloscypha sp. PMI_526]|nr:hypothetical protein DL96DRAFT_1757291 [Flagelloscypha sp. PMI_526]
MSTTLDFDLFPEILCCLKLVDLKACSVVCSSLHHAAEPLLFSHICLGPWDRLRLPEMCAFYLFDPRGKQLRRHVRTLTVRAEQIPPADTALVPSLIEVLANIRTLHLRFQHLQGRREVVDQLMGYVSRYIFPGIIHLTVDVALNPSPIELLLQCPLLQNFEIKASYFPRRGAESVKKSWAHLHSLTIDSGSHSGLTEELPRDAWVVHAQSTVKNLCVANSTTYDYKSPFPTRRLIGGFTALCSLSLGLDFYYFAVRGAPQRASPHLPVEDLPHLQKVTFRIGSPRHQDWSEFFYFVGRDTVLGSDSIMEVFFELLHPTIPSINVYAIRTSRQGIANRRHLFPSFNELAFNSKVRLNFTLTPVLLHWSTSDWNEDDQRCGFELVASVIKRWLSTWYKEGKLEIWRRW